MTLDPAIFKAYDVRGIVPDQLDPDGAYRIARAYDYAGDRTRARQMMKRAVEQEKTERQGSS